MHYPIHYIKILNNIHTVLEYTREFGGGGGGDRNEGGGCGGGDGGSCDGGGGGNLHEPPAYS